VVHVCVFAFVIFDRDHRDPQKEVVIEFAPSKQIRPEPAVEKVVDISGVEHAEPEQATMESKPKSPQLDAPRVSAMQALLALDLTALRANVVRSGLRLDGPSIRAAGFAPLEPSIHLTDGEVDSLVIEERGSAAVGRKRGVKGKPRQPTVCILPPR
jgi:hypothetical protein